MAVIHRTTLKPSKLEVLAAWLPTRPWYRGGPGASAPQLVNSGGFRLDDPEGEVGIEFMVTTDTCAPDPTPYLVPLTYRGAPLDGAQHALIGTMEHGVLGKRWAYDGCFDPVLVTELLALIEGRAQAMAQSISDTPDHDVIRAYTGAPLAAKAFTPEPVDDNNGTRLTTPTGAVLHVHRVLDPVPGPRPVPALLHEAASYVARGWQTPDGSEVASIFFTLTSDPSRTR
jgi:Maltokinase N-terminal cap domain